MIRFLSHYYPLLVRGLVLGLFYSTLVLTTVFLTRAYLRHRHNVKSTRELRADLRSWKRRAEDAESLVRDQRATIGSLKATIRTHAVLAAQILGDQTIEED